MHRAVCRLWSGAWTQFSVLSQFQGRKGNSMYIRCDTCCMSDCGSDMFGIIYFAVAITRYVSLGSILVVISFLIQAIVFNHMGLLGVSGNYAVEFDILAACFTAMAIWRHRANIKRLLSGTENKFGQKAK